MTPQTARQLRGQCDRGQASTGEFIIVRKGVEHRVVPQGHVKLMLFEPTGIAHTGKVKAEITLDRYERLETNLKILTGLTIVLATSLALASVFGAFVPTTYR